MTNNKTIENNEVRILRALRRIIRSTDIYSRKLSSQHNVTAPQLVTLIAISEYGPITIAALSSEIHLSASTLVGIIDRLEDKGLVTRERDTKDRRRVFIQATEEGRRFAEDAPSPLQEKLARALDALPADEQRVIAESVEHLVDFLEAEEIDAAPILETGLIHKH